MEELLNGLNPAQHAAVTSESSVLQVLAPPGSGKTKTLTARVAFLVEKEHFKPWNIIVCTFTVKAAKEMKERVKHLVGDKQAKQLQLGTFHGIALRYLKKYGHLLDLPKDFGIADSADSKAIVTRILKQQSSLLTPGTVRSRISSQKAQGVDSEQFACASKTADQKEFAQIYAKYDNALRSSMLLDYDDILLRCVDLLYKHPSCVGNIEAVLIDEFQDTNNIQYKLMGLFAQYRNHVTIVGDPDQSIYGFRAAEIENLSRMKQRWPDTLTINLKENYRSSGAILHAAQKIIEQDTSRPQKSLQATHSLGLRPVLRLLPSPLAEAEWLVSEVKRLQALSGNLLTVGDFAILIRAASLSRVIESALGRAGIAYRMVGGTRFYSRVEVKLLVDYLRVVSQPEDDEAVQRTVNMPSRKVGDASIKALVEQSRAKHISLWKLILDVVQGRGKLAVKLADATMKGLTSYVNIILTLQNKLRLAETGETFFIDLVSLLIKKIDMQNWLKQKYPDDYEGRWSNVEEVIAQATEISDPVKLRLMMEENVLPVDGTYDPSIAPTLSDTLSLFLSNVALSSSAEEVAENDQSKLQQLTVSTIHAAKGLEWPVVFVPACYDGSIPHSRAEDWDEERRLLYVGMTRAQTMLYLSRPMQSAMKEDTKPSPFLTQPGVHHYFEEHGPSISGKIIVSMAKTLSRQCPSAEEIAEAQKSLKQDEDNHWPLNGELPLEALVKLNYSDAGTRRTILHESGSAQLDAFSSTVMATTSLHRTTMSSVPTGAIGFASVATQYHDLMQQSQLQREVSSNIVKTQASAGRHKRPDKLVDSKVSIARFFQSSVQTSKSAQERNDISRAIRESLAVDNLATNVHRKRPLGEMTNLQTHATFQPSHKIRNVSTRPIGVGMKADQNETPYGFLSSPPTKAEDEQSRYSKPSTEPVRVGQPAPILRPAASLHVTSMQMAAEPRRKTLGMRRSVQGWTAKPMKRPNVG